VDTLFVSIRNGKISDAQWMRLSGNTYINVQNIVEYNGEALFTLKREEIGELGIYFDIYDSEGKLIAKVKRKEIYIDDKSPYAIDGSADRYVLTE
jgi:hypothetical protein